MSAAQNQRVSPRATGIVGIAIFSSRILGLIREIVIASLFGATKNMDAFLTAFRAPNMLRDLFAEGALSTAFVTTFSRRIATEGDESAWRLASKVATLTVVFMSALTLLGVLFAPAVITILAPGFAPDKAELTILLTRIMFPFILLVSLAALVMGMLNARNVFGMPAMASSFFNLGSIRNRIGGTRISASVVWSVSRSALFSADSCSSWCSCHQLLVPGFGFVPTSIGGIKVCGSFSA